MKTKAMQESWVLIKNYKMNKSDALKQGWLLAKNHHAMRTRKSVMFEFLKTDGKTIRKALGTINPMFVPPTRGLRTRHRPRKYSSMLRKASGGVTASPTY